MLLCHEIYHRYVLFNVIDMTMIYEFNGRKNIYLAESFIRKYIIIFNAESCKSRTDDYFMFNL